MLSTRPCSRSRRRLRHVLLAACVVATFAVFTMLPTAWAQYRKKGPPTAAPRQSYSDYYLSNVQRQATIYGVRGGATNPRKYIVDKYYYHNPAISPYLNLARPRSSPTSNYFSYTVPEQQRRQAAAVKAEQARRNSASRASRPTSTSSYYNQFYGGRQMIGLK